MTKGLAREDERRWGSLRNRLNSVIGGDGKVSHYLRQFGTGGAALAALPTAQRGPPNAGKIGELADRQPTPGACRTQEFGERLLRSSLDIHDHTLRLEEDR